MSTTQTLPAVGTQVHDLAIAAIHPSPLNPRKAFDEVALRELAADIDRHGVKQPILVRPKNGAHEIVVGERRWRASRLAKRSTVPAIIEDLDDEQVREIQLVENLQRANIHPLEEADAFNQLYGQAIKAHPEGTHLEFLTVVAKRVSRDVGHIAKRMKLGTLIPAARDAFLARDITLGHAILLATLQVPEQEKALRFVFDPQGYRGKESLGDLIAQCREKKSGRKQDHVFEREAASERELRHFIEEHVALELKKAPWDLADKRLVPDAGACTTCTKRTGANTALFGELLYVQESTCMDGACFNRKKNALVQLVAAAAVAKDGRPTVQLSHKFSTAAPKGKPPAEGQPDKRVFRGGQFVAAKKADCEHVVTGVYVDYPDNGYSDERKTKPGSTRLVCVTPGCKAHKKQFEQRSHHGSSGGYDPVAEEKKRKEREQKCAAEKKVRLAIAEAALAKVTTLTPAMLTQLVLEAAADRSTVSFKEISETKTTTQAFVKIVARVLISDYITPAWDPNNYAKEFNRAIAAVGSDPGKLRRELEKKVDTRPTDVTPVAGKPGDRVKPKAKKAGAGK